MDNYEEDVIKDMMPKLFTMLKNKEITKQQVMKDIIAGIIVAVIALPLSIALAISHKWCQKNRHFTITL